jgi:hypothetical protein
MKALLHVHASLNSSYSPIPFWNFLKGRTKISFNPWPLNFFRLFTVTRKPFSLTRTVFAGTTESVGISRTYVSLVKKTRRT